MVVKEVIGREELLWKQRCCQGSDAKGSVGCYRNGGTAKGNGAKGRVGCKKKQILLGK